MTFSPLTAYAVEHHNKFSSRGGVVPRYLTIHHWAGVGGGDTRLVNPNEGVSCNYILYGVGDLVGQVPEQFRAWTSGSWEADAPGITVETQNSGVGGEWPVTDAALEKLAQLAADLSTRYEWGRLDRSRVRGHREFASTTCPGPYLWARLGWIIDRANEILDGGTAPEEPQQEYEEEMNTYFEATSNSSPVKAGEPGTSRIWAGADRVINGVKYSAVWERSPDGTTRRLFAAEWAGIQAAYAAAGRKLPLAKVHGNAIEQMQLVARHVPKL